MSADFLDALRDKVFAKYWPDVGADIVAYTVWCDVWEECCAALAQAEAATVPEGHVLLVVPESWVAPLETYRGVETVPPPRSWVHKASAALVGYVAAASQERASPCTWTQDDGAWDTSCGNCFEIYAGTPAKNGMKHCCYCGKTLVERASPPAEGGV